MSLVSRLTTWISGQVLKSSDLNSEFNNIVNLFNNLDSATSAWTNINSGTFKKSGSTILSVSQLVVASTSTAAASTSASFADTNLTASITPISTTSKILILAAQSTSAVLGSANSVAIGGLQLLRGASVLYVNDRAFGLSFSSNTQMSSYATVPFLWQDAPASTSSVTYKTQFNRLSGSDGTINVQHGSTNTSYLVLIETL